jgi:hypothetical protein
MMERWIFPATLTFMVSRLYLDELLHIWEHWTDGDSVLRCALQASAHDYATRAHQLDKATAQFMAVARRARPGDSGAYAAVIAGGALLLALQGINEKDEFYWHRVARDAREAHHEVLEGRQRAQV